MTATSDGNKQRGQVTVMADTAAMSRHVDDNDSNKRDKKGGNQKKGENFGTFLKILYIKKTIIYNRNPIIYNRNPIIYSRFFENVV